MFTILIEILKEVKVIRELLENNKASEQINIINHNDQWYEKLAPNELNIMKSYNKTLNTYSNYYVHKETIKGNNIVFDVYGRISTIKNTDLELCNKEEVYSFYKSWFLHNSKMTEKLYKYNKHNN